MRTLLLLILAVIHFPVMAQVKLMTNVKGYTLNNEGALIQFSQMAFENGRVLAIGDDHLVYQYPQAAKIDGQGKTLLPGLIDAHGHMLGLGQSLLQVDVRDITSAKATVDKVAAYAKAHTDLEWIVGGGWNQVLWPDKQFPNATQMDEGIANKPVWLERIDGHAGWANSRALEIAGITADTLDPPGGKILRDAQGNPTGVLIDTAMYLVGQHIPKANDDFRKASLDVASEHLLSLGITSMHDAGISEQDYQFYINQANAGELSVRIYAMIVSYDPNLSSVLKAGKINDKADFLSVRSVKVYGDGALGSRGASLLEDYHDAPGNRGLLVTPEDQLPELFDQVISSGFQINYHAIGDRANRLALDNFAASFERVGGQSLRHRVEHAQVIDISDIPRFKQLGILPSMQPTHATSDMNMAKDRLGEERLKGAYAWQSFVKQGSPLPLGSDFPVELANPFFGLHAAVTRQDRNNQPPEGWRAEESLTLLQAFKGFTIDAAYAAHQEQQLGGLTEGKWADFILLDQDIFAIPEQQIWKTQVLQTWVAGQLVFSQQE